MLVLVVAACALQSAPAVASDRPTSVRSTADLTTPLRATADPLTGHPVTADPVTTDPAPAPPAGASPAPAPAPAPTASDTPSASAGEPHTGPSPQARPSRGLAGLVSSLRSVAALPAQGVGVRPAGYGEVRLGPYAGPAGSDEHGYCVQARVSPTGPGDIPERVGIVVDPLLAAAMAEHRWSTDDVTQAALALTAHQRHEQPGTMEGGNVAATVAAIVAATPPRVLDRQREILAEAARAAGPFAAEVGAVDAGERRTGVLRGIALRSAAGEVVAGKQFTVTLHGPAVFDLTGGPTYSGTTGPEPIDLTWTATGTGTVTSEVRFHGATRTTLTRYDMAGNRQDQISYGNRPGHDPETITHEPPPFEVAADFQPVATSDVGASKVVDAGQPIADTLTVSAAPGDSWLRVDGQHVPVLFEGTAYGIGPVPVPEWDSVPGGAPVVARTSVTATGPGTYTATADGPTTGQVITWVWRVVKAHQPAEHRDLVRADWSDAFGLEAETSSVRWTTGTVDSAISIRVTQGGTYLVDDVMITGLPEDHPEFTGGRGLGPDRRTVSQELWFFSEGAPVLDENLGDARLLGTVEVPARNGYHPSISHPSFRVEQVDGLPTPGTYVFRTVFEGDDRVAPFTSSVADVTEQHVVLAEPLAVTTRAAADRDLVAAEPAVLHDVATVTGVVPAGAALEFALHHWDGDRPVCTDDTMVHRTEPIPLTAPGEHRSASTGIDAVATGRYGYVETVRAADGRVLHRGECGIAAETLVVRLPDAPPPSPVPTVTPADSSPALAVTGAPAFGIAAAAVLVLTAGVVAVGSVRRRPAGRRAAPAGAPTPGDV